MIRKEAMLLATCLAAVELLVHAAPQEKENRLVMDGELGRFGGHLVATLRSEPKTFNPALAADNASRAVIHLMMADLLRINRETHSAESSLASAWEVSPDGKRYTLELRKGVRFSDGHLLDADDVLFTFEVYLDEAIHSPQRDLLIIEGRPIAARKIGPHTVGFELAGAYGAAERLFDSIAILPQHLLEKPYREGKFQQAWSLAVEPQEMVGLGPFRLERYVPGERVVLERNPHYWKFDRQNHRLPYLDRITFLIVPSSDAEVMRFRAGETHVISRMSADDYVLLESEGTDFRQQDLGPGLEYNFLFFNLNDLPVKEHAELARKQSWFREVSFRRAVSAAIDREGIVRLVYRGRATPLWSHVTPGNKLWFNEDIPRPRQSLDRARMLLSEAGFRWNEQAALLDPSGRPVEFSILTSSGNVQRSQIATIIQEDLRKLGMRIQVVTLEFRALIERIFQTYDYEASLLALGSGDVDPTSEMNVWLSQGTTHLWHLGQSEPATQWEAEIDRLMQSQMSSTRRAERKRLYDRVQQIVAEQLPLICIASPNILVGVNASLGNFRPAILPPYTLWNAEQLFFRQP